MIRMIVPAHRLVDSSILIFTAAWIVALVKKTLDKFDIKYEH